MCTPSQLSLHPYNFLSLGRISGFHSPLERRGIMPSDLSEQDTFSVLQILQHIALRSPLTPDSALPTFAETLHQDSWNGQLAYTTLGAARCQLIQIQWWKKKEYLAVNYMNTTGFLFSQLTIANVTTDIYTYLQKASLPRLVNLPVIIIYISLFHFYLIVFFLVQHLFYTTLLKLYMITQSITM